MQGRAIHQQAFEATMLGTATIVNDLHSRLNATAVREIVRPASALEVAAAVRGARDVDTPIAIAGGRHAMGGQQFLDDGLLLDMSGLDRVLDLDPVRGEVEAEAGIQWPA